jgi:HAD superfamily hydrolase (TIGR01509 family)
VPVLEAVLWDMDGLLVDTEPLWTVAQNELAAGRGRVLTVEMKAAVMGTRLDVAVPRLLELLGVTVDTEAVGTAADWLLDRMAQLYSSPLQLLPGAAELLSGLRAEGVPVALVSSSYRVLVDAVLRSCRLSFDVTVAGDEVERGKPDPEPYLTAAAALGACPGRCVVLEDSAAGVAAGQAAGCAVLACSTVLALAPASGVRVVPSLAGVAPADLRALVRAGEQGAT